MSNDKSIWDIVQELFKTIIEKWFGDDEEEKVKDNVVSLEPKQPEKKEPEVDESIPHERREPPVSKPQDAVVDSFLWKPRSDHHPHHPVVLVSVDQLRSEDLHLELFDRRGRKIQVGIRNTARANLLGGQKWGRIHFRIDEDAKKFPRGMQAVVFQYVNGKRDVLKKVTIRNPSNRLDQIYR